MGARKILMRLRDDPRRLSSFLVVSSQIFYGSRLSVVLPLHETVRRKALKTFLPRGSARLQSRPVIFTQNAFKAAAEEEEEGGFRFPGEFQIVALLFRQTPVSEMRGEKGGRKKNQLEPSPPSRLLASKFGGVTYEKSQLTAGERIAWPFWLPHAVKPAPRKKTRTQNSSSIFVQLNMPGSLCSKMAAASRVHFLFSFSDLPHLSHSMIHLPFLSPFSRHLIKMPEKKFATGEVVVSAAAAAVPARYQGSCGEQKALSLI